MAFVPRSEVVANLLVFRRRAAALVCEASPTTAGSLLHPLDLSPKYQLSLGSWMRKCISSRKKKKIGGEIAADWARFKVEPPFPAPCDQAFDVEMYCDRWAAQEETYPMLSLATRTIAKMHPTEAACDRNKRATADTREKATEETEYRGESRDRVENLFKRQARDNTNYSDRNPTNDEKYFPRVKLVVSLKSLLHRNESDDKIHSSLESQK
jgi:hypothetical protein